jgi:hypothetical protein
MYQNAWFLVALGVLSGCASTPEVCPSVEQEKVSMCRARAACKTTFGQRYAASHNKTLHILQANVNMCIANEIEVQKSNAALKLMGAN